MLKTATPLLIALMLATPAFAQETATDDTTTEQAAPETPETATEAEATPTTDADPADGLSLGSPLDNAEAPTVADLAIGQPYVRGESGDWLFRCLKAEEGTDDPCQLYQLLKDSSGNSVAEISLFPLAGSGRAAAGATIVAPLETLLTQQLTVAVDGGAARRYPFTFCNTAGCVARVGFTAEEVAQFKRGNAATITMVPAAAPDETVELAVSLSGFTAGYDELAAAAQ
ncbi:invasion protein IalB [Loktanella ponticola]|uniref:Invasion protein IalB n=1 Tax=Yoonia ponticola TaxID=1524255 RepID=A0A7W9EZ14_9RHOB|nr:invasion associated locus B family protein [Yoonia ponticola]MBB5721466.1 invasion protein IalB [Yoonia ponticola]